MYSLLLSLLNLKQHKKMYCISSVSDQLSDQLSHFKHSLDEYKQRFVNRTCIKHLNDNVITWKLVDKCTMKRHFMWQIKKFAIEKERDRILRLLGLEIARIVNMPRALTCAIYETRESWLFVTEYAEFTDSKFLDMVYSFNSNVSEAAAEFQIPQSWYDTVSNLYKEWSNFWRLYDLAMKIFICINSNSVELRVGFDQIQSVNPDTYFKLYSSVSSRGLGDSYTDQDIFTMVTRVCYTYELTQLGKILPLEKFDCPATLKTCFHSLRKMKLLAEGNSKFTCDDYLLLFCPDVYSRTPFHILLDNAMYDEFLWLVKSMNQDVYDQFFLKYSPTILKICAYLQQRFTKFDLHKYANLYAEDIGDDVLESIETLTTLYLQPLHNIISAATSSFQ